MIALTAIVALALSAGSAAPTVSENTGALDYRYAFDLPAGRGSYQPTFSIAYSSSARTNAGYGVGWVPSTSYVEKDLRAPPASAMFQTRSQYWITRDGDRKLLVQSDPGSPANPYRPESAFDYFTISFTTATVAGSAAEAVGAVCSGPGCWEGQDGRGNRYVYECQSSSCDRWYLTWVVDPDNNLTSFIYAEETTPVPQPQGGKSASARLKHIRYNAFPASGPSLVQQDTTPNPSVGMTANWGTWIELSYVSEGGGLGLGSRETVSGTMVDHVQLLKDVFVRTQGYQGGPAVWRQSTLNYHPAAQSGLALLSSIQELGWDGASKPATTFDYFDGSSYSLAPGVTIPIPSAAAVGPFPTSAIPGSWPDVPGNASWQDVDGDGRPDLLWGVYDMDSGRCNSLGFGLTACAYAAWARNTTAIGASQLQFSAAAVIPGSKGFPGVRFSDPTGSAGGSCSVTKVFDFNGDGLPDFVQKASETTISIRFGEVAKDANGNFVSFRFAGNPANGDLDFIVDASAVETYFHYGREWPMTGPVGNRVSTYPGFCIEYSSTGFGMRLQDVNGDGLADFVSGAVFLGYRGAATGSSGGWAFSAAAAGAYNKAGTLDLTGDGIADYANAVSPFGDPIGFPTPGPTNTCDVTFVFGLAGTWATTWPAPNTYCGVRQPGVWVNPNCGPAPGTLEADPTRAVGVAQDMNGDGLPDYVARFPAPGCTPGNWWDQCPLDGVMRIRWNGSRGLVGDASLPLPTRAGLAVDVYPAETHSEWSYTCGGTDYDESRGNNGLFIDANGDGIPDYVYADFASHTWSFFAGSNGTGAPATPLLKSVHTPLGAQYDVTYVSGAVFGSAQGPVVKTLALSGTAIESVTTTFWYANPQRGTQPADERTEPRGFGKSWSQNSVTGIVHETTWGATHWTKGLAAASQSFLPSPSAGWQPGGSETRYVLETGNTSYKGRSLVAGRSGTCSTDPQAADAPLLVYSSATTTWRTRFDATRAALLVEAQKASVACQDVDDYGNIAKVAAFTWTRLPGNSDPTWPDPSALPNGSDDPRILLTESLRPNPNATCKTCSQVTRSRSSNGTLLLQETQVLDSKGHVVTACKGASSLGACDGAATFITTQSWHGDGSIWKSTSGGVTKQFAYDAQQLRVIQESTSDGVKRIATDHVYDPAYGIRSTTSGPYLARVKRPGDSAMSPCSPALDGGACVGPVRHFDYDGFGRPRIVAQARSDGQTTLHGNYTGWVEAYEYGDSASPAWGRSYRFGDSTPTRAYSFGGLSTNDVVSSTTYTDALGRAIQQRDSLGGGQTAMGGRVVQTISGKFRVVKAVVYDGAGRVRASVEPFHSSTGAFQDLRSATPEIGGSRASVTAFDSLGLAWCQATVPIPAGGQVPAPPSSCTSDSSDTASFRLATETRLGVRQVSAKLGNTFLDGPYLSVKVIPPDLNLGAPGGAGVDRVMDAAGRDIGSVDPEGNAVWILRDALGREVAAYREGPSGTPKTPQALTTYDASGLVTSAFDPTWGNPGVAGSGTGYRDSFYDSAGRLVFLKVNRSTGAGVCYIYGDLGRVTRIEESPNQASCGTGSATLVAANYYDQPYSAADSGYSYPAGRLTWTATPETTIAYGYDDAGRPVRRDQWFAKIEAVSPGKRFTMTTGYGADGRALSADFLSPGNATFTHAVDYDSAGRPVRISSGSTVFWEATTPGGAFASHDALGRVPQMKADSGKVVSQRTFGSYNGALLGEYKHFTTSGDIFVTTSATYQGTKLAGFNDGLSQTSYTNTYWPSGRLKRADASPYSGATAGPLTQDYTHDHVFDGLSNLGSVSEAKNARTPGMPVVQRTRTPSYNSTGDQMASLTTELTVDGAMRQSCTATFTYDAQGRMATRGGSAEVFSYDLQGHLTQVTRAGVVAETLGYGPTGELLWRQVGSQYLFYVGEYATIRASTQGNVAIPGAPVNASALEVDAHVLWVGARIASVAVAGLGGRTLYYYRTRLGSVIATSIGGGIPGAMYRYTPYGMVDRVSNETASTASDLGYTGALRLTGNLVYLKNRVYHAGLKVFLQPDSVDRLRYAYVAGDPANASDPSGLAPRITATGITSVFPGEREFAAIFAGLTVKDHGATGSDGQAEAPASDSASNRRHQDAFAMQNEPTSSKPVGDSGGSSGGDAPVWLDWNLKPAAEFFAGFADTLTSGFGVTRLVGLRSLTETIRNIDGTSGLLNTNSNLYLGGELAASVWGAIATMGGSTARAIQSIPKASQATEGIYEFVGATGRPYVGQSSDIAQRISQHLASGKLPRENMSTLMSKEVLGGKTAREIAEQLRINELGGIRNLENVRNPIGPARQHLLKQP